MAAGLRMRQPCLDILASRAASVTGRQQVHVERSLLPDRTGVGAPMQQIRQRRDVRSLWSVRHIGHPRGAMRLRSLRRVRSASASGADEMRPAAGPRRVGGLGPLPRTAYNPEALPVPVLSASGAGSVTIVVPQGRGRAPASNSRSMRQGSLVPAAAGCWGRDGCRQGLERHDRLHCLPKATPCSSTGRYAVSGAKGTPVTVEGRPARPAHHAPRSSLPCPRILARGGAPASPGTLPSEHGVEGKEGARSRSARPATAEQSDSGEYRCRWPAHLA
jgi:hypothetical protein